MRVTVKNKKRQWLGLIEISTRELMLYIDRWIDKEKFNQPKWNISEEKWFKDLRLEIVNTFTSNKYRFEKFSNSV